MEKTEKSYLFFSMKELCFCIIAVCVFLYSCKSYCPRRPFNAVPICGIPFDIALGDSYCLASIVNNHNFNVEWEYGWGNDDTLYGFVVSREDTCFYPELFMAFGPDSTLFLLDVILPINTPLDTIQEAFGSCFFYDKLEYCLAENGNCFFASYNFNFFSLEFDFDGTYRGVIGFRRKRGL